ncbi:MAG: hypothetical protein Q8904_00365 [Bacteroidota bacterium]|nr:hypothetical protein [Bacteroidota bacterium]
MKKKIVILSLIAVFVSLSSLNAQTKTVTKSTAAVKEVKAGTSTSACCKGKTAECCKGKTETEKAKCMDKCKKETEKACTQKAATKKTASEKK